MKIVVGVQPDEQGDEALARAEALARSMRAHLVLAHVYPTPWRAPEPGVVDSEWRAYLVEQSRSALLRAERRLSGAVGHELVVHAHTSTGRGLAEVAEEHGGSLIVIGAGPGGEPGRLHGGSTADQLLHGASVPVLLVPAPEGDGAEPRPLTPSRVTVAYQRSLDSAEALHAAAQLCRRTGAPLRLVTLVLHPPRTLRSYERSLDDLRADARHWLDEALIEAPFSTRLTAEIAEGDDFEEAMAAVDCEPDELLVCGSGTAGPLRRVFLGDTAQKILRAATVPVLVVPRHAEAELDRTRAIPKVRD
ncbi:MAG: universal stress protein [Actinomycetes bacterium]